MARKRKQKKGQLSIETLLIYGTVLLVATLAISALVYFGVLDLGKLLPDRCQLGGSEIVCENYVGATGGDIQLELRNQIGKNIDLMGVSIVGEDDWEGVDYAVDLSGAPVTVNNGALSSAVSAALTAGTSPAAGDKYKGRLVVEFRAKGSTIDQTKSGTILLTFS